MIDIRKVADLAAEIERDMERKRIVRMLEEHVDHVPGELTEGCDVCWRGSGIRNAILLIQGGEE